MLVIATVRAHVEGDKELGFGFCRIGTTLGPVEASTIPVYAYKDAGGYEYVTLTAVTEVFPAGTHSFGVDCTEDIAFPMDYPQARVSAVSLSAN